MPIAFAQRFLAGFLCFMLFLSPRTLAGGGPVPLNVELDLAQTVVTGKLVNIANEVSTQEGKVVRADVQIKPTTILKGDKNLAKDLITVYNALVKIDRVYAMSIAPVMKVYRKDDEGAWVIMPNGEFSFSYGLLTIPEKEIQTQLDILEHRTWSKEVNGLKAWASVAYYQSKNELEFSPRIILAVQNVSKSDIGVPYTMQDDMISITARNSTGKEFKLSGIDPFTPSKSNDVSCDKLEPGKIQYIDNMSLPAGVIADARTLPPGKYTVTASFSNTHDARKPTLTNDWKGNAWKGKLLAPPFTLEIPETQ